MRETIAQRINGVLILIFFNALFYHFDGIFITKGIHTFTCLCVCVNLSFSASNDF